MDLNTFRKCTQFTLYSNFPKCYHECYHSHAQCKSLITALVLSTMEGNIHTWECLSVHHWWGGGVSRPRSGRGVPHPRSGWGVPIPGVGGYPVPGLGGGVTLSQVWGVPHPRFGQGLPGVLPPLPGLDGVPPL